jgi:hypothetical protein
MSPLLLPFQLVLLMFAGWMNRHQLDVIEYLQEENRVLKERLGGRGTIANILKENGINPAPERDAHTR